MDNKLFWKTIEPSLSNKLVAQDRIHLTETQQFFAIVTNNLKILKCTDYDTLIDSIENCTRKALLKNRNHPSIFEIHKRKKNR